MALLDNYLATAIQNRASDIHLASGEPIRFRIDGDLTIVPNSELDAESLQNLIFEILTEEERERLIQFKNLDKCYSLEGHGFFRVNCFWTRKGIAAVLRTIPQEIPTMEDLGLPEVCKTLSEAPKGLVLVTGPTGSGKSTTLASMINHINTHFPYHILTVEDPVEFVHPSKKSLINQREIGSNCPSFADALKYALREDPDVILLGEMRDLETIALALTAAETGHLVFGTLHTRGAAASMDRIIDSFPSNQQAMIRTMLSESLVGVISQSLLKRSDKPGRIAVHEVLVNNHAVSNLIREGKTFQITSVMQTAKKEGMLLMEHSILDLVQKGIVSSEEAATYLESPEVLNKIPNKIAVPKSQNTQAPITNQIIPPVAKPPSPPISKFPSQPTLPSPSISKPVIPVLTPTISKPVMPTPSKNMAPIPPITAPPKPVTPPHPSLDVSEEITGEAELRDLANQLSDKDDSYLLSMEDNFEPVESSAGQTDFSNINLEELPSDEKSLLNPVPLSMRKEPIPSTSKTPPMPPKIVAPPPIPTSTNSQNSISKKMPLPPPPIPVKKNVA